MTPAPGSLGATRRPMRFVTSLLNRASDRGSGISFPIFGGAACSGSPGRRRRQDLLEAGRRPEGCLVRGHVAQRRDPPVLVAPLLDVHHVLGPREDGAVTDRAIRATSVGRGVRAGVGYWSVGCSDMLTSCVVMRCGCVAVRCGCVEVRGLPA